MWSSSKARRGMEPEALVGAGGPETLGRPGPIPDTYNGTHHLCVDICTTKLLRLTHTLHANRGHHTQHTSSLSPHTPMPPHTLTRPHLPTVPAQPMQPYMHTQSWRYSQGPATGPTCSSSIGPAPQTGSRWSWTGSGLCTSTLQTTVTRHGARTQVRGGEGGHEALGPGPSR